MHSPSPGSPDPSRLAATDSESARLAVAVESRRDQRNFIVLAAYQVVLRIGWIFKTESVMMPAVLDSLGGPSWLRGCLPLLNRFGQNMTPLLIARRVKISPRKKWAQVVSTLGMAIAFLALSIIWMMTPPHRQGWLAVSFLGIYALFSMISGANQLAMGTLQGKLVPAASRGRLMLAANLFGSMFAIVAAATLMPLWLTADHVDFRLIFGMSAIWFFFAAATSLLLDEPADHYQQPRGTFLDKIRDAAATLSADANFRRLALVAVLFDTSLMLFPHYQALARSERVNLDTTHLMHWVVVQNVGTGLFSLLAGPLADRYGNRFTLRLMILGICAAPLVAVVLSHTGSLASQTFAAVFLLVGSTPVVMRMLQNYTLEIAEPPDHPRYLATLSICLVLPIFFSPIVGKLIDVVGFDPVFIVISALVFVAWLTTFRLAEPRHQHLVIDGTDTERLDEIE